MALVLDDFLGFNLSQDDEEFTILNKKHLMELRPSLFEKKPAPGEVFVHQELSSRIIADYDRLLFHHQAGTGKTRVIIHSREYFRSFMEEQDMPLEMRRFNINKAYILTPSRTLIAEFRREIISHMGAFYEEHIVAKRSTAKDEGALIKAINKYYEILTHGEFVKLVESKNPASLDAFMSNCIVYVDEAHKTSTIEDRGEFGNRDVMSSDSSTYVQLHRAFHAGSHNKIVLLTATPMINRPQDITLLMNLILPLDRQMLESELDWETTDQYQENFGSYFRGYVSYILRGKTGAIKKEVGTYLFNPGVVSDRKTIGGGNVSVAPSSTGAELGATIVEFQVASYLQNQAYNSGLAGGLKSFGTAQLQLSNFIFPPINTAGWFSGDARYPTFKDAPKIYLAYEQERSALNPNQRPGRYNTPEIKAEYKEVLTRALTVDLPYYSTKLDRIRNIVSEKYVNRELEDPDYLVPDNKGICFIYSHLVKYGVEMVALMLKLNGYSEFNEKHSVFSTKPIIGRDRVLGIQKARRYFLMTGSTSAAVTNAALELLNSYENRFGEYIQVFIGSEVASHGLNVNHAVAMLFLTPLWNHTNEEQSQDRVFRSVSHDTRLKYKADNNLPEPDSIQVEVYKMTTVFETPAQHESVDFYLYQLSTLKDDAIKPMIETIRKFSIDCVNNSDRNQLKDCARTPVSEEDYSEKLKWYLSKEVNQVSETLESVLFQQDYVTIVDLERITRLDKKILLTTLLEILDRRLKFLNRLGVRMTLNHSNGIFFLNDDLYMKGKFSDLEYTKWFLATKNYEGYNLLQDYMDTLNEVQAMDLFQGMKNIKTMQELKEFLPEDYKTRIRIFEHSFQAVMHGDASFGEQMMFEHYKNQVYKLVEPIEEINDVIRRQDRPAKGRKAGVGKGGKLKIEDRSLHTLVKTSRLLTDRDADIIYLHMMIPVDVAPKVAMADFSKAEGYIRVYKTKEGRWRQCNQTEYEVYQRIITRYRSAAFDYFERTYHNLGVYALKIDDLVVMKTTNANGVWNKGKQCNNYKATEKREIVDKVWRYHLARTGVNLMRPDIKNCRDLIQFLGIAGLIFDDKQSNDMVNLSSAEDYSRVEEIQRAYTASAANIIEPEVEEDYAGFGNFQF